MGIVRCICQGSFRSTTCAALFTFYVLRLLQGAMADSYNSRDPRSRRATNGRVGRRGRLTPVIVRRQPAAPSRVLSFITRLLFVVAALLVVLLLAGVGSAYGAYRQLATSLSGRLDALENHKSFQ